MKDLSLTKGSVEIAKGRRAPQSHLSQQPNVSATVWFTETKESRSRIFTSNPSLELDSPRAESAGSPMDFGLPGPVFEGAVDALVEQLLAVA